MEKVYFEMIFIQQELRQMNNMKETMDTSVRRKTLFGNEIASDQSHLKAEVVLLQRKYDRLAQKERRLQVHVQLKLFEKTINF